MLEIVFLIWFCKKLAAIARSKNRGGSWGALGAIGWVGGEVTGAILGASHVRDTTSLYGYMILGAVIGAVVAYVIVKALPEIPRDNGLPIARVV